MNAENTMNLKGQRRRTPKEYGKQKLYLESENNLQQAIRKKKKKKTIGIVKYVYQCIKEEGFLLEKTSAM